MFPGNVYFPSLPGQFNPTLAWLLCMEVVLTPPEAAQAFEDGIPGG